MNDHELLELAGKAGGIDAKWLNPDDVGYEAEHEGLWLKGERSPDNSKYWNPLTDDGDALRLAVKLQLTVCNEHVNSGTAYCTRGDDEFPTEQCQDGGSSEVIPSDYAATRRAIVRAAAEIGSRP